MKTFADLSRFRRTDEINEFLNLLEAKSNSMIVKTIGKTHEGRDIKLVEINSKNSSLPIIFIECGIHAREWISPASALFIIDKLNQCTEKVICI